MKASDRRKLPKRDLGVTALGLGCSQMGSLYKPTRFAEAQATFDAAWAAGIRYYDTAPYYGHTRSERRLGTMLTEHGVEGFVVSTKVGRVMVPASDIGPMENDFVDPLPFRPCFDYSHDGILRSFEASQHRLGLNRVDMLYVHDIGRAQHGDRHEPYWQQLTSGGGFKALDRLRREGSVTAVGLGVNEWEVVRDAAEVFDLDVAMLAGRYTLLEQDCLAFLDRCARDGLAVVAAGVFNSGILAGNGKFNYADAPLELMARTETLRQLCHEAGVSLQAAALQFPMAHPAIVSVVVGARSAAQIVGNVGWFEEAIPDKFWQELRSQGLIAEQAPLPGTPS